MSKKNKKKSDVVAEQFESRLLDANADNAVELLDEVGDKAQALVEAWVRGSNAAAVGAVAWAEQAPAGCGKAAG